MFETKNKKTITSTLLSVLLVCSMMMIPLMCLNLGFVPSVNATYVYYTYQPANSDTWLYSSAPDTNYGSSSGLVTYDQHPANIILSFNISSIQESTIANATLSLYIYSNGGTNDPAAPFNAYRLTKTNWTELGATWNTYDGSNNWATAGGDFDTTNGSSASWLGSYNTWISWDVTNQIRYAINYVNKIADFWINESSAGSHEALFYSSQYTTNTTLCPVLNITASTTSSTGPPTYSNISTNQTIAGLECRFSSLWYDPTVLSGYVFGTNNTGSWINETWTAFTTNPDWANKTKTLNSTAGDVIQYEWWANNTSDYWNSTGTHSILTIQLTPTFSNVVITSMVPSSSCDFDVLLADVVGLSGYIFGNNNSGTFTNNTWTSLSGTSAWANTTITLNSTEFSVVSYEWWFNDTWNEWNSTGLQYWITTTTTSLISHLTALVANTDWTTVQYNFQTDVDKILIAYQMGVYNSTQVANLASNMPSYPMSPQNSIATLYIYSQLMKYGIEDQSVIEWALDQITMCSNGLPNTEGMLGGGFAGFSTYHRFMLWGYYWAQKYNYETSKWNMTTAYNSFKACSSTGLGGMILYTYDGQTGYSGDSRYYDEGAETMDCFLTFYQMGINDGLTQAVSIWNYINNNYWHSGANGYYWQYQTGGQALEECELGGFAQIALKLLYYYGPTLGNLSRISTDLETRLLNNLWSSDQWAPSYPPLYGNLAEAGNNSLGASAMIIHAVNNNYQKRLENNLMAYSAIYADPYITSPDASNFATMLEGYNTSSEMYPPAWQILWGFSGIRNSSNYFATSFTPSDPPIIGSGNGCFDAAVLTFMMGIVPQSGRVMIAPSDMIYEDTNSLADAGLNSININNYTVNIAISIPGIVGFIYGNYVSYNFTQQGLYTVVFSSNWNSISSVTFNGGYPITSSRIFLDFTSIPPIFGTPSANTTLAGQSTQISCTISDNAALQHWGFAWNNTGSWVNASAVAVSDTIITALYNGTWNSTAGNKVSVQFWADDLFNNTAYSSVETFTLTSSGVTVTVSDPTNTTYITSSVPVNFTASGWTIDQRWFNCKNGTSWIYGSNQTYAAPTSMTGFVDGSSYTFYAWANDTVGTVGQSTVMFSVTIPSQGTEWENNTNTVGGKQSQNGLIGQTFTVTSGSHTVTSVYLHLSYVTPTNNTITVSIRATSGKHPTGSDLTSGTMSESLLTSSLAWYQINMATEYTLVNNTRYAIVVRDNSTGTFYVGFSNYAGSEQLSVCWNSTWLNTDGEASFQIWGNIGVSVVVNKPVNTTYLLGSTIPVNLTASSAGTLDKTWFNVLNDSSWVYASNQTYTAPTTMTGFVIGNYTFYGYANDTIGDLYSASTPFSVNSYLTINNTSVNNSTINPSGVFIVSGVVYCNGTSIVPINGGTVTIYAALSGAIKNSTTSYDSNGNFNFSVTGSSFVGQYNYTVYAINSLGVSVANQTVSVIVNKLIITLSTDTVAPSGGVTVHMNATAVYAYDGTNVTTLGVTIGRNGTSYSTSTTWTDAEIFVTTYNFTVLAANDTTYGLTAFTSNTLTIAWQQTVIEVSSIYQNTTHTGVNQTAAFSYRVIFGGNSSDVTSGYLAINGTIHSISNGWCNFTATNSNIELATYIASGSSFSNTVFSQLPADPQVIFDYVNIVFHFTSQSPQTGQNIVITWTLTRLFDSSTVTNYNITINMNHSPVFPNITQSNSSITDSLAGSGSKTYSIGSFTDLDYNMTSFTNIPQMVTWYTQGGGGIYVTPVTPSQPTTIPITIVVMRNSNPVVDVQVAINGQVMTTDRTGSATFSIPQGNYAVTVSYQGSLLYSGSVSVSTDNQVITVDLTPPSVIEATGLNPVSLGIIVIAVIIILALVVSFSVKPSRKEESWRKLLK